MEPDENINYKDLTIADHLSIAISTWNTDKDTGFRISHGICALVLTLEELIKAVREIPKN